jgi:signal peptidase I
MRISGGGMKKRRIIENLILIVLLGFIGYKVIPIIVYREIPYFLHKTGIVADDVKIAGTGSMYPTFPKGNAETDIARANEVVAESKMKEYPGGITIGTNNFFGYVLKRGDIVSFENKKTRVISKKQFDTEAGFVKRIIGLPGDTIEIRDGYVFVNTKRLDEPYTARARSTFGGTLVPDCKEIVVPREKYFVLGDNRTGSGDSRHELGLVDKTDIDHVLPYANQQTYMHLWRDASGDSDLITQPTLDTGEYVDLLNKKRKEAGLNELKIDARLVQSASSRGKNILVYNDISFEATKSGYTMEKALIDVGYHNIVWGEAPSLGYYTQDELIENSFAIAETKKFLLEKDFTDVGVSAVLGTINGCPTQIVVQHFAGYVPPNYSKAVISSWHDALKNLRDVAPGWQNLITIPDYYSKNKTKVDRINDIIRIRIERIEKIILRLDKNEWLTSEEQGYIDVDKTLYEEQNRISQELNDAQ